MSVCEVCSSPAIDERFLSTFGVPICSGCKKDHPESYSLVTKTAAMRDFLITSEELNDKERLPHLERPNPHKSTWHNMQLYLRKHLTSFAIEKYGSLESLEHSKEKWAGDKIKRKEQKYTLKLRELRKKTRSDTWNPKERAEARHSHNFADDNTGKTCTECGFRISFVK